MRQGFAELDIGMADREHFFRAGAGAVGCLGEAPRELIDGANRDREMQIGLVLEIDVDERAAQSGAARHRIHRHGVPAHLAIKRLGRIDDLVAATVLLFLAAFGDVRHGARKLGAH